MFEAAEEHNSALQQELDRARLKIGDIGTELATSKAAHERLQAQFVRSSEDFKNKLQSAEEENEAFKRRFQSVKTELTKEAENAKRELAAKLNAAEKEKNVLEEKLADMRNRIQEQQKQLQLYVDKDKQKVLIPVSMPSLPFTPMQDVSYHGRASTSQQPSVKPDATLGMTAMHPLGPNPLVGQKPLPAFNAASIATGSIKNPDTLAGIMFANTHSVTQGGNMQYGTEAAPIATPHPPSQSVAASSAGSSVAQTATGPFNLLIDDHPMEDVFQPAPKTHNTMQFTGQRVELPIAGLSSDHADITMGDTLHATDSYFTISNAQRGSYHMRPSDTQNTSVQFPLHAGAPFPQPHPTNPSDSFTYPMLSITNIAAPQPNGPTTYGSNNGATWPPSTGFSSAPRDYGLAQPSVRLLSQPSPSQVSDTTAPCPQRPQLEPPGCHNLCWCIKGSKTHAPYCTYALEAMNGRLTRR